MHHASDCATLAPSASTQTAWGQAQFPPADWFSEVVLGTTVQRGDPILLTGLPEITNVPRPKTLDMRLAVTTSDLANDIMRAFNLAKSAGLELNATFTRGGL